MVKRKCLKLLYSSNRMYKIDCQLKKLIRLNYLILETPHIPLSLYSVGILVLHELNTITYVFRY